MPVNDGNFKEGNKAACLKPEIKAIRIATKENLFNEFSKYCQLTIDEYNNIDDTQLSLLSAGILKSLLKFRETGEYDYIRYILDQVIGRAKESIELTSESDQKIEIIFTEKKV